MAGIAIGVAILLGLMVFGTYILQALIVVCVVVAGVARFSAFLVMALFGGAVLGWRKASSLFAGAPR